MPCQFEPSILLSILRKPLTTYLTGIIRAGPGGTYGPGAVRHPKVLLVTEGGLEYAIGGHVARLKAGSMFFRPTLSTASWRADEKAGMSLIFAEFEVQTTPMPDHALWTDELDLAVEHAALSRVRRASLDPDRGALLEAEAEMKAIFTRFFRKAIRIPATPSATRNGGERAVREAMAILNERFADAGVVADLHERVRMSRDHFRRVFKRTTGHSPQQYLLRVRIESARAYLHNSNLSVKEVARAVGYDDPLYFSRLYSTRVGRAPSEERARRPATTENKDR